MTWFGGDGWGWCGLIFNVLAMAVFWGAAIVLAVHFLTRERRDLSAMTVAGSTRTEAVSPVRLRRGEWTTTIFTAV